MTQGQVQVTRAEGVAPEILDRSDGKQPLRSGDRLEIREDSEARITLEQEIEVGFSASSVAEYHGSEASPGESWLELLLGKILVWVDPNTERTDLLDLETTPAIAAAKGTEFSVEVFPDQSAHFKVCDGVVELSNAPFRLNLQLEPQDREVRLHHRFGSGAGLAKTLLADDVLLISVSPEASDVVAMDVATTTLSADPGSVLRLEPDEDPSKLRITAEKGRVRWVAEGQPTELVAGSEGASSGRIPWSPADPEPELDRLGNLDSLPGLLGIGALGKLLNELTEPPVSPSDP